MLPVFTAAEMRALDARAIASLGIPGPRLMEAAGSGAAAVLARRLAPLRGRRVVVVCGKGNNGGDGFVVARRLAARGARVRVYLVGRRGEVRGDAAEALGRWRGPVAEIGDAPALARLESDLSVADLIVDALLGTGLTGPARGPMAEVIEAVNRASARAAVRPSGVAPERTARARPTRGRAGRAEVGGRVSASGAERPAEAWRPSPVVAALDVPSGVDADRGAIDGPAIRAHVTVTFAGYKRALLLHPACALAGEVVVVPIGIPDAEVRAGIGTHLLEEGDARAHLGRRETDTHKGTYGHLLVVAGSRGKAGAAALAGRAGLRSGAGLVTVATAESQQPVVAGFGMEIMTEACPETAHGSIAAAARAAIAELAARSDAVAVGPGVSLAEETQALVRALVGELARPMVVDADGLGALVGHLDVLDGAAAPRLLTPHPGEMARLAGTSVAAIQGDRLGAVRDFCMRHRVWLVLKGAHSVIGGPDGALAINPTGNPGMATAGAGDVLTGMAGAFLARGLAPRGALEAAVYLHGAAGDLAARARGEEGLIAGDILDHIPAALRGPS
jgi:NAD(P)H-hydrate epimerase